MNTLRDNFLPPGSRLVDIHVGARMKERRRLVGIGRSELAKALGLSVQQVQKYESGDSTMSALRLHQVGEQLGVAPGYFFEGMQRRQAPVAVGESTPAASELRQMMMAYRTIPNMDLRHRLYELACAMARVIDAPKEAEPEGDTSAKVA